MHDDPEFLIDMCVCNAPMSTSDRVHAFFHTLCFNHSIKCIIFTIIRANRFDDDDDVGGLDDDGGDDD